MSDPRLRWVEYAGMRLTLSDWARRLGVRKQTLASRLRRFSVGVALTPGKLDRARPGAGRHETVTIGVALRNQEIREAAEEYDARTRRHTSMGAARVGLPHVDDRICLQCGSPFRIDRVVLRFFTCSAFCRAMFLDEGEVA